MDTDEDEGDDEVEKEEGGGEEDTRSKGVEKVVERGRR